MRILMKQECTEDWVHLLPSAVLAMNFNTAPQLAIPHTNCSMGGFLQGFSKPLLMSTTIAP